MRLLFGHGAHHQGVTWTWLVSEFSSMTFVPYYEAVLEQIARTVRLLRHACFARPGAINQDRSRSSVSAASTFLVSSSGVKGF